MQSPITSEEKKAIKTLTRPHGRKGWFCENAGITREALKRLMKDGQAAESNVFKVRAFLQKQEQGEALSV